MRNSKKILQELSDIKSVILNTYGVIYRVEKDLKEKELLADSKYQTIIGLLRKERDAK